MSTIEVKGLYKSFGRKKVLNNVNFTTSSGMIGLLGNNGAGKTTLMNMISALTKPTRGQVLINGIDTVRSPLQVKKMIGYLPQDFNVYDDLTANEMLDYIATLNHIGSKILRKKKVEQVLEMVNLTVAAKEKVGTYSGGMKRRLGIGLVLIKNPQVIVVDEPTAGLDPLERIRFRTLLTTLSADRTILLSTHIVEDISASCDQLVFIQNHTVEYLGTPNDWLSGVANKVAEAVLPDRRNLEALSSRFSVISMKQVRDGIQVRFILNNTEMPLPHTLVQPNLEDAFLYYSDKAG